MILTVCHNPSVDCTIELDFLNIGQLNRIRNKQETYAGKALNVALSIKRLGGDCLATGFMFEENGKQFVEKFSQENLNCNFVWNPGSVRVNYKIIDNKSMMTEINDRGALVSEQKQEELIALTKDLAKNASIAVMSGSLPQGVDDDFYLKLCNVIPKNVKIILDCEGEKFKKAISAGVYLVKPNLSEFEAITGRQYTSKSQMIDGAKKLISMGAKHVLLSLGQSGAILTNGSTHLYCRSATVAVNSTVGAGDSMIAAASLMIERGESLEQILRSAVAAGTASITTPGTNLFYKDKYQEIYDKIYVEKMI